MSGAWHWGSRVPAGLPGGCCEPAIRALVQGEPERGRGVSRDTRVGLLHGFGVLTSQLPPCHYPLWSVVGTGFRFLVLRGSSNTGVSVPEAVRLGAER